MGKIKTNNEIHDLVERFGELADKVCEIKKELVRIGAELADIIIKSEMKEKKEHEEKLPRIKPNAGKETIKDFFSFTNTILDQIERDMARSPFAAKVKLSSEEDARRMTKDIYEKSKKSLSKSDAVSHPQHYQGKTECIDAMEQEFGSVGVEWFCLLNAFKYEYRKGKKVGECNGAVQDIKKRNWYIDKFNELRKARKRDGIRSKDLEELVNKYR